jgi:protein-disulfide isomerase/uncharacterized membrane protein
MAREALTPRERFDSLRKFLKWIVGLGILGALDSIWLLVLHASKGSITGVCSVAPHVSCDALFVREYSEWFGIPVPVFSIIYFGLLIVIAIRALRSENRHVIRPYAYLWILGWLGLGTTLYMAYIALILLKTFCPYCAVLWITLIVVWLVSLKMMKMLDQPWGYLISEDLRAGYKSAWFWGVGFVAIALLTASFFLFREGGKLVGKPLPIVGEEARSLGPAGAKSSIVVFSDFQCPWCRVASEVLQQLARELPGEVRVVYKFFPLDSGCNEFIQRPMHPYSCAAATAAYCASVQGKFWIYHDYLFTSQDELPETRLIEFARMTQLDLPKFDACCRDRHTQEEIVKNVREGNELGIRGTPSIFVNGQQYSGPITLSALKEAVTSIR